MMLFKYKNVNRHILNIIKFLKNRPTWVRNTTEQRLCKGNFIRDNLDGKNKRDSIQANIQFTVFSDMCDEIPQIWGQINQNLNYM